MRKFRHLSNNDKRLDRNVDFKFALRFTMCIYDKNAVATFIPKNACSTLRYSIAAHNGFADQNSVSWVHNNNTSFNATIRELVKASYKFVFVRCPYKRTVSAYLDKIVNHKYRALNNEPLFGKSLVETSWSDRLIDGAYAKLGKQWRIDPRYEKRLQTMTFRQFIDLIEVSPRHKLDQHWRPQMDFLIYREYDDIFITDNMQVASETLLEKIGLEILDTRAIIQHSKSNHSREEIDAADMRAVELFEMLESGVVPDYRRFYDAKINNKFKNIYADDIELIRKSFGEQYLAIK